MNRREALSAVSVLFGGTIIGADFFLAGCKATTKKKELFNAADIALLDEISEIIIPATPDSGGGKAAGVGIFMKSIVSDCYTANQQKVFIAGISQLKAACHSKYGEDLMRLSAGDRKLFLTELAKEARDFVNTGDYKKKKEAFDKQQDDWVKAEAAKGNFSAGYMKDQYPPHYFTMMKQLTLWGYFSSKTGMTQALRYIETPGKYDGDYPYSKGEKAWAS